MTKFANILAVIQHKEEAPAIIDHVKRLAGPDGQPATIHIVRVVYESIADISTRKIEHSAELKQVILKAEESYLEELLEEMALGSLKVTSNTLWNKRTWEAVLHTASALDADLIVKANTKDSGKNLFTRTPDDWNLLRHTKVPVLLVGRDALPPLQPVVAAVDALDSDHAALNQAILNAGAALTELCNGSLHIVASYPRLDLQLARVSRALDVEQIQLELEQEIQATIAKLTDQAEISDFACHIEAGAPAAVVAKVTAEIGGGILVIGTKARAGIEAAMLGNTAETLVQAIRSDVLVVPA